MNILTQKEIFSKLRPVGSYVLDRETLVGLDALVTKKPKLSKKKAQDYKLLGVEVPKLAEVKPSISLHMVVDTEFRQRHSLLEQPLKHSPREPLTTQMMHVFDTLDDAIVLAHEPHANTINAARVKHHLSTLPVAKTDVDLVDYLRLKGYDCDLRRELEEDLSELPVFEHCIYGHFLLAELFIIHRGEFATDLLGFVSSPGKTKVGQSITMNRRLTFSSNSRGGFQQDRILLPWVLTLNGQDYRFALAGFDTGALHGIASFADLLEATALNTDNKLLLTKEDKSDILQVFIDRPLDAELYARGDLLVYQALVNNSSNFECIYRSLDVPDELMKKPKMTIGATVYNLFTSVLRTRCGLMDNKEWERWSEILLTPASAASLRERRLRTTTLMSKVQGGRCRNNRPDMVALVDLLADLDIDGAYGEGQRNQEFPFGKPESLYDYELDSPHKHYYTLREALKLFGATQWTKRHAWDFSKCELVPGLFFMLVSSLKPLEYMQDFFCSWYAEADASGGSLYHKLQQKLVRQVEKSTCDTERESSDAVSFNEEDGELKIHLREVINGVLTWDGLQWILNVCSPKQREELLDNLQVNECLFYSATNRVQTPTEVMEAYKVWNDKTKASRIRKGKKVSKRVDDGECHIWCAFNLGELLIDRLLCNRKLHPKKTPMNTLYKLCVNTLYGDMVSKYFTSANVIVGNNITARCRALAWYMEHGLNGFQTITDGCVIPLNAVVHPYEQDRVFADNLTMLWTESNPQRERHIEFAPLPEYVTNADDNKVTLVTKHKHIGMTWIEYQSWNDKDNESKTMFAPKLTLTAEDGTVKQLTAVLETDSKHEGCQKIAKNLPLLWINEQAFNHLRYLFPGVDVLHKKTTKVKPIASNDPTPTYEPRIGQFTFETKDVYDRITLKGTSDYCLVNPNGSNTKMRSHELKKPHVAMDGSDDYASIPPGLQLMDNISKDASAVPRLKPAVKEGILKPSDYSNRREYYSDFGLVPGDNIRKPMMIREFSLTQFTFTNRKQYLAWKKAIVASKQKYGQSLEVYFRNPDGTLDFAKMVATVAEMVYQGVQEPFVYLDKHRNQDNREHPYLGLYQEGKSKLNPGAVEFAEEDDE